MNGKPLSQVAFVPSGLRLYSLRIFLCQYSCPYQKLLFCLFSSLLRFVNCSMPHVFAVPCIFQLSHRDDFDSIVCGKFVFRNNSHRVYCQDEETRPFFCSLSTFCTVPWRWKATERPQCTLFSRRNRVLVRACSFSLNSSLSLNNMVPFPYVFFVRIIYRQVPHFFPLCPIHLVLAVLRMLQDLASPIPPFNMYSMSCVETIFNESADWALACCTLPLTMISFHVYHVWEVVPAFRQSFLFHISQIQNEDDHGPHTKH